MLRGGKVVVDNHLFETSQFGADSADSTYLEHRRHGRRLTACHACGASADIRKEIHEKCLSKGKENCQGSNEHHAARCAELGGGGNLPAGPPPAGSRLPPPPLPREKPRVRPGFRPPRAAPAPMRPARAAQGAAGPPQEGWWWRCMRRNSLLRACSSP